MSSSSLDHAAAAVRAEMDAAWRKDAACAGRAAVMNPPAATMRYPAGAERARLAAMRLCWRCPVLTQCRTWVLGLDQDDDVGGFCGGLSHEERLTLRRRDRYYAARATTADGADGQEMPDG